MRVVIGVSSGDVNIYFSAFPVKDIGTHWRTGALSAPSQVLRLPSVRGDQPGRRAAHQQVRRRHQRHHLEVQHRHHRPARAVLGKSRPAIKATICARGVQPNFESWTYVDTCMTSSHILLKKTNIPCLENVDTSCLSCSFESSPSFFVVTFSEIPKRKTNK